MSLERENTQEVVIARGHTDYDQFIGAMLPIGDFRRVCIKPNWVYHASHEDFPIEALVTSPALIEATVRAVVKKYSGSTSVVVGDVPLQSCDFDLMFDQSGMDKVRDRLVGEFGDRVEFRDLRREAYREGSGGLELVTREDGDPDGYREVVLDDSSLLDEVSTHSSRFRVSDYDPVETQSTHRKGSHRYLVCGSVLNADLVINLPKMKTHKKNGITGALKNLVGINGSKARLVHHRVGHVSEGGDEFPPDVPLSIKAQVRARELLQKRSRFLFRMARTIWQGIKKTRGIQTVGTRRNLSQGGMYIGAGEWNGNDSIWRMVYDLNYILRYADSSGVVRKGASQRRVLNILDGIVSGEGNGPLQPLPVESGILVASENPFLVDFVMAKLMGFDWRKLSVLSHHQRFADGVLGDFDPEGFQVMVNGQESNRGVDAVPVLKTFLAPPGWQGHVELDEDNGPHTPVEQVGTQ